MPFYTYQDTLTGKEKEFMLPVDHDIPIGKNGEPMIRVFKATHHVIPTDRVHEKSQNYQQGYINEREY